LEEAGGKKDYEDFKHSLEAKEKESGDEIKRYKNLWKSSC